MNAARPWLLSVITLLPLMPWAMGTPTVVTMKLTGPPPGPSMAGVYTSPYTATINGVSTLVICDDFTTDVSIGTPAWNAYETLVSALPSTLVKFDTSSTTQQEQDYATAAYLAEEILAQNQQTTAGQYQAGILSYALWGLFYTPLLSSSVGGWQANCTANHYYGCLTSQQLTDSKNALSYAAAHAGSYAQYSNVKIYTPEPNKDASQEYLVVTAPEPTALTLLAADLSGLVALLFLLRRHVAT